jgi:hypothetical protein
MVRTVYLYLFWIVLLHIYMRFLGVFFVYSKAINRMGIIDEYIFTYYEYEME